MTACDVHWKQSSRRGILSFSTLNFRLLSSFIIYSRTRCDTCLPENRDQPKIRGQIHCAPSLLRQLRYGNLLTVLALYLLNSSVPLIKYLCRVYIAILTFVNFTVSILALISNHTLPSTPPLFTQTSLL